MALSQLPNARPTYSSAHPLMQAQAWLQNALNMLDCGADIAQARTMLHQVERHLGAMARTTGPMYIGSSLFSSYIRFGVKTGRGYRYQAQPNEDNLFAVQGVLPSPLDQPFGFFVVADSMGGSLDGQTVSSIVILQLVDFVLRGLMTGETELHSLLVEGIKSAHQVIQQYNQQSEGKKLGSLVTAVLVVGQTATVANIGDNRMYLYRSARGLQQITKDHSVVALMVSMGLIKAEEIYTHPLRKQVYRTLGALENAEVDLFTVSLENGDKLLLCSDGLWGMVRDPEIEYLMRAPVIEPADTAKALYEEAIKGGGVDNISVIVVEHGISIPEMKTWQ